MPEASAPFIYSPYMPEVVRDPYPFYERLREEHPVYRVQLPEGMHESEAWAISRYADVQTAARNWETFTSEQGIDPELWADKLDINGFGAMDPPRHDALRKIMRARFQPVRVAESEAHTRAAIEPVVERFTVEERTDLGLFANEMAFAGLADLLGLAEDGPERLQEITASLFHMDPDSFGVSEESWRGRQMMTDFMGSELDARRSNPTDDVLTLIAAGESSGEITRDEAISICGLLIQGSLDTSASGLGNSLNQLAAHPSYRAALAAGELELGPALEELLRFDSPIQYFMRRATCDHELHGVTIRSGEPVFLIWGSANRDPRQFDHPDELDFDRGRFRHLAFGEGPHFCLGAVVARQWIRIALGEFLRRAPNYELEGEIAWKNLPGGRGPESMPARLNLA